MLIHPDQAEFCKLWGDLVKRSWDDEALRERLKNDAAGVLKEYGYELPPEANIAVEVNESTDQVLQLYMPCEGELADPTAANAGVHAQHCLNNQIVLARMATLTREEEEAAATVPAPTVPTTATSNDKT